MIVVLKVTVKVPSDTASNKDRVALNAEETVCDTLTAHMPCEFFGRPEIELLDVSVDKAATAGENFLQD